MPPRTAANVRSSRSATPPSAVAALTQFRVRVVWISFLAAMTLVGGLLLLLDGRPVPRLDGLSLSPLAAAGAIGGDPSLDPVLQTRVKLASDRWTSIVIHHSGAAHGSPASIEREHQDRRFRGLGYHFIIGNGNGMEDGQLHVGYRWLDQLPGAHAAGPSGDHYNLHSISICLIGDGNRRPFTPAQLQRFESLLRTLKAEFRITDGNVLTHQQISGMKSPGSFFPVTMLGGRGLTGIGG